MDELSICPDSRVDVITSTSDTSTDIENELRLEITNRQQLFIDRFVSKFSEKRKKYRKTLEEYGIIVSGGETGCENLSEGEMETSFSEEIEIIISENRNSLTTACKKGGHYSISRLFRHIFHTVRRTKASRISAKLQFISESDIKDTLHNVASQLSSAYEYQILMVANEREVRKMADHAVSCITSYLKLRHSYFNPGTLLQSIIENTPKKYFSENQFLRTRIVYPYSKNVKVFDRWKVQDVFKQPGLRVRQPDTGGYKFYGCFTPFGSKCKPHKYGFRDPLYVWDEEKSVYTMLHIDQTSCHSNHNREISYVLNNYHSFYKPVNPSLHTITDIQTTDNVKVENEDDNGNIS